MTVSGLIFVVKDTGVTTGMGEVGTIWPRETWLIIEETVVGTRTGVGGGEMITGAMDDELITEVTDVGLTASVIEARTEMGVTEVGLTKEDIFPEFLVFSCKFC